MDLRMWISCRSSLTWARSLGSVKRLSVEGWIIRDESSDEDCWLITMLLDTWKDFLAA